MNKLQTTTRIWDGTLEKIRVASALAKTSQVQFIDDMVNFWLSLNGYDPKQIEGGEQVIGWQDIKPEQRKTLSDSVGERKKLR